MIEKFDKKKILILLLIILLIGGLIYYIKLDKEEINEDIAIITTQIETSNKEKEFYVDVKGNVKKPGVYKFKDNDRVIDAINKAGGLTKNADTSNINLSKKLTSEMVVYIYNKNEIKKKDSLNCNNICNVEVIEVNNCIEDVTTVSNAHNDLVNINSAGLDKLITIPGIGESKAKSIIEYRSSNGLFKTIDDLKNVSGIGDALFEKIKDKIIV